MHSVKLYPPSRLGLILQDAKYGLPKQLLPVLQDSYIAEAGLLWNLSPEQEKRELALLPLAQL